MTTSVMSSAPAMARTANAPRVVSIDIFRGITMAVMIFVNQLSGVRGLPWWTYHAHAQQDVMTYVDMVFPFFLFIVGMSMPLSIAQRLKRNPSTAALWLHVLIRVIGLLVLGLILANAEKCDPARMPMDGSTWGLLGLLSAGLYLNMYGKMERLPWLPTVLRIIGLAGVVVLLAIFRRTTHDGRPAWIDFSYPEILGLIGLSYLAAAILYIPTRRWKWAPPVWFVLLVALNILTTGKILHFPNHIPMYFWPFGNGAMSCIIMGGVVTSLIVLGNREQSNPRRSMAIAACFGVVALAAGWLCTPLGISKIRATPTWSLYSVGAAVLMFTALYWICDVKRWTKWAFIVHPAGANTLTTYLLPDIWDFLCGVFAITFIDVYFPTGWEAVVKTFVFTFCILGVAWVLTRAKVRLQF